MPWLLVALASLFVLLTAVWLSRPRRRTVAQAMALFSAERSALEQEFFARVAGSGKPRGLTWASLEWEPGVVFARERATGKVAALVGVTIRFEAIPGGDMEGLPAVANLRNASAVFFFDADRWHTTGRVLFNLDPEDALMRFGKDYERLTDIRDSV